MSTLVLAVVAGFAVFAANSAAESCDEGFVLLSHVCIKFDLVKLGSFNTQQERCQEEGALMIAPDDAEEEANLFDYTNRQWPRSRPRFWIGLKLRRGKDAGEASNYYWQNSRTKNTQFPSGALPWEKEFPRRTPAFRCVMSTRRGSWVNARCNSQLALACQYDPKFGRYTESQTTTPESISVPPLLETNTSDEITVNSHDSETTNADTNFSGNIVSSISNDIGSSKSVFSETTKSVERETSFEKLPKIIDNSSESTEKREITLSGFDKISTASPEVIETSTLDTDDTNASTKNVESSTFLDLSIPIFTSVGDNIGPGSTNKTHSTSKTSTVPYPTGTTLTNFVEDKNKSSSIPEIKTEETTFSSSDESIAEKQYENTNALKDGEEETKPTPKGVTSKGSNSDKKIQEDIKKLLLTNVMSEEDYEQIKKVSSLFVALHQIRSESTISLNQNIYDYNPAVAHVKLDTKNIESMDIML